MSDKTKKTDTPEFTEDDLRILAWAIEAIPWIPGDKYSAVNAVAKKLEPWKQPKR